MAPPRVLLEAAGCFLPQGSAILVSLAAYSTRRGCPRGPRKAPEVVGSPGGLLEGGRCAQGKVMGTDGAPKRIASILLAPCSVTGSHRAGAVAGSSSGVGARKHWASRRGRRGRRERALHLVAFRFAFGRWPARDVAEILLPAARRATALPPLPPPALCPLPPSPPPSIARGCRFHHPAPPPSRPYGGDMRAGGKRAGELRKEYLETGIAEVEQMREKF